MSNGKKSRLAFASAIAAMLVVCLPLSSALAQSRQELEDKQAQIEQERNEASAHIEGIDSDLAELFVEIADIDRRIPIAEAELVKAEGELATAEREQAVIEDRLATAQRQHSELLAEIDAGVELIETTEATLGALARDAYRSGGSASLIAVVLDTQSPAEFTARYASMNGVMRTQNQTINEVEDLQANNRNRQVRLEAVTELVGELKAKADAAVAAAAQARTAAANLVTEITGLKVRKEANVQQLESRRGDLQAQIADLDASYDEIGEVIAEIDRKEREEAERKAKEEADRKAKAEAEAKAKAEREAAASRDKPSRPTAVAPPASSGSSGGGSGSGSTSGSGSGSGWVRPVTQTWHVTSAYGYRTYYLTGTRLFHRGVDLRSACGESQRAIRGGTVSAVRGAYGNGTHGNQVMINHGMINGSSYVSVYNHLSGFAVSVGQKVSAGQTIGYTGATGMVTGCHVHLEVWKNGSTIDPMTLPGY